MWNYSQSGQEFFALQYSKNKSYIEIGAYMPTKWSNTYILETKHNFKGISIEFNKDLQFYWNNQNERENKIYWNDATTFDYSKALKENNLSTHIGYLSCDIEPPSNTFLALQKVIESGITFDCITFEHDKYNSDKDYDKIARKYLKLKGYKAIIENVYPNDSRKKIFETWFVKEDIPGDLIAYEVWKENMKYIGT